MFISKLAGLINPLSTVDSENECNLLFLLHGFPLLSHCAEMEPLLCYTGLCRDSQIKLSTVSFPVALPLEAPWVLVEALRNTGACGQKPCSCIRVTSRASYPR